jgi:hypothetical protein
LRSATAEDASAGSARYTAASPPAQTASEPVGKRCVQRRRAKMELRRERTSNAEERGTPIDETSRPASSCHTVGCKCVPESDKRNDLQLIRWLADTHVLLLRFATGGSSATATSATRRSSGSLALFVLFRGSSRCGGQQHQTAQPLARRAHAQDFGQRQEAHHLQQQRREVNIAVASTRLQMQPAYLRDEHGRNAINGELGDVLQRNVIDCSSRRFRPND